MRPDIPSDRIFYRCNSSYVRQKPLGIRILCQHQSQPQASEGFLPGRWKNIFKWTWPDKLAYARLLILRLSTWALCEDLFHQLRLKCLLRNVQGSPKLQAKGGHISNQTKRPLSKKQDLTSYRRKWIKICRSHVIAEKTLSPWLFSDK